MPASHEESAQEVAVGVHHTRVVCEVVHYHADAVDLLVFVLFLILYHLGLSGQDVLQSVRVPSIEKIGLLLFVYT